MAREIGRIESEIILNRVERSKQEIVLQYVNIRFNVIVDSVVGARLQVRRTALSDGMLLVGRVVQLFFEYRGTKMTILPRVVRDWGGGRIELLIERPAWCDISRGFERVYNDSSIIVAAVDHSHASLAEYPATIRVISEEEMAEYAKDLPTDTESLIKSFLNAVQEREAVVKIIMFREHPPQHLAEKVMAYLGRPVIIPYREEEWGGEATGTGVASDEAIADAIELLHLSMHGAELTTEHRIPDVEATDIQILVPIICTHYCVGYVLMSSPVLDVAQYRERIEFMEHYGHALSYVLKRSGYFDALTHYDLPPPFRLVDVSSTGLRFSHTPNRDDYPQGAMILLAISLPLSHGRQTFMVGARVVNRTIRNDLHYVSVQFSTVDPAFSTAITGYLYQDATAK